MEDCFEKGMREQKNKKKMGEKFYKGGMNWDFRKKKQREIDRVENKGVFLERKGKKKWQKRGET